MDPSCFSHEQSSSIISRNQPYQDPSQTLGWECLSESEQYLAIFILILVIILIIGLIVTEYKEQDCIPGKKCGKRVSPPHKDDDILTHIDTIDKMIKNNYQYNIWRLSLLAGLIATIPVVYFLRGRIPILIEWIVIGGLIFLATYLAFSWIWAHFFYPNSEEMEKHLRNLRDKI